MKEIAVILVILLSLSGCITQVQQTSELVTIPNYTKNDILKDIQFNVKGGNISLSIYKPDKTSTGTLSKTFEQTSVCIFPVNTYLYYPGLWKVEYSIDDSLEGTQYFWVENTTHRRDVYEIANYYDNGAKTTFDVYNVGKVSGWVNILAYNPDSVTLHGKQVYGITYYNENHYVRPGQKVSVSIPNVNPTVLINGEVYNE